MRTADIARLILLAAIWGGSFLLLRMVAPVLGAIATADARVLVAALALSAWLAATGRRIDWRRYALPLVVVGITNSAIPFAAFSYAALTLPAGYSAILNATAPLFSAALAALLLGDALGRRKGIGLACGIAGVSLLVGLGPIGLNASIALAVGAALTGALSYAVASAYVKSLKDPLPPAVMATGSQWVATAALLPLIAFAPVQAVPSWSLVGLVLALGVVCTAVGYMLYFRLIGDVGPVKALTVTFLIPLFALLWGALVLGEAITLRTVAGGALVILATWLVLGAPARRAGSALSSEAIRSDAR